MTRKLPGPKLVFFLIEILIYIIIFFLIAIAHDNIEVLFAFLFFFLLEFFDFTKLTSMAEIELY